MVSAYSYIRFSTPEQSKGDSHRRQWAKSADYALAHGLILDDQLSFSDLGKSAYRGKHATDGGLALFRSAIEDGRVAPGSFLLIENLDRLSRQPPIEALKLLESIVAKGVTVVTLTDGRIYTQDNLRNDPTSLLISIIVMFRAYEESKMKGERVRQAWHNKKQNIARTGVPITKNAPFWLKVAEGSFEVLEEKAAIVRRIFDLATNEGLGQRAICTRLKEEGVVAVGRAGKWTETSVRRIITNASVIGLYQPHATGGGSATNRKPEGDVIEGFFPKVIEPAQFYDAQRLRSKATIPRGPRGDGVQTIFTGILFCECGATMRRKGASKLDLYERVRCSAACGRQSWKYDPLEKAVLTFLSRDLLPHVQVSESDRKLAQARLAEAQAESDRLNAKVRNLTAAIEEGGPMSALLVALKVAEADEPRVEQALNSAKEDLAALENHTETADDRQKSILAMAEAFRSDTTGKIREKLRYALSRSVDRIVLEDSDELRTVCIEVGSVRRYIDFSRSDLTFVLRGEEIVSVVRHKLASGRDKLIIP